VTPAPGGAQRASSVIASGRQQVVSFAAHRCWHSSAQSHLATSESRRPFGRGRGHGRRQPPRMHLYLLSIPPTVVAKTTPRLLQAGRLDNDMTFVTNTLLASAKPLRTLVWQIPTSDYIVYHGWSIYYLQCASLCRNVSLPYPSLHSLHSLFLPTIHTSLLNCIP